MYYNHDDKTPLSFTIILIIVIIIFLFVRKIIGANIYNNGICTNCSGSYQFVQAIGHQASTDYMYKCNKCGQAIEVPNYYPPNN